jgi:Lrp/AsnC family transcriptional regulator, regulator for asnA, asnC and gidA
MINIDEVDAQILTLIQRDARQSSEVIARTLNLSSATVRRRINRLIKNNVLKILGYVNPGGVGLPFNVMIALSVSPEQLKNSMKQLNKKNEVVWLAATSGRYNIMMRAVFASAEEFYTFMREGISDISTIRTSETFICLHVEKSFYKDGVVVAQANKI